MARLNKRQLKKARKKRIDQLFKNYDKELVCELLSNQLRVVDWVDWVVEEGHDEIFVSEEALKLIIEHSK
ncbi:putative small outer capsid protein [Escherichia phage vB_EcoM_Nami]|nr:putative small outer capsid protein [Escherichia phage vB_EcoM_Nami]